LYIAISLNGRLRSGFSADNIRLVNKFLNNLTSNLRSRHIDTPWGFSSEFKIGVLLVGLLPFQNDIHQFGLDILCEFIVLEDIFVSELI
jgi:hypothetical protein